MGGRRYERDGIPFDMYFVPGLTDNIAARPSLLNYIEVGDHKTVGSK